MNFLLHADSGMDVNFEFTLDMLRYRYTTLQYFLPGWSKTFCSRNHRASFLRRVMDSQGIVMGQRCCNPLLEKDSGLGFLILSSNGHHWSSVALYGGDYCVVDRCSETPRKVSLLFPLLQ